MFHQIKTPYYAPRTPFFSPVSPSISTLPPQLPKEQAVAKQSLGMGQDTTSEPKEWPKEPQTVRTFSYRPVKVLDYTTNNPSSIDASASNPILTEEDQKERTFRKILFDSSPNSILILKKHGLRTVPEGSLSMPIEVLNLEKNELTELPSPSLQPNPQLKILSVEHNKLTTLPPLHELTALTYLNATHNKIAQLSETFIWPKELQYLFLSDNDLQTLPETLKDVQLKELHIRHNPLIVDEKLREILLSLRTNGCNINCDPEVGQQFDPPMVWKEPEWEDA